MTTWETLTMSRKGVTREGLLKAALAGTITNAQGALALHLSMRQFQRTKRRVRPSARAEAGGAGAGQLRGVIGRSMSTARNSAGPPWAAQAWLGARWVTIRAGRRRVSPPSTLSRP